MRRRPYLLIAFSVVLLHTLARGADAQKASACRPSDASTTEHLGYLRMLSGGSTQAAAKWRTFTHVPFITDPTTGVTVVTTSKTCSQALSAYVARTGLPANTLSQVEVLRADTVMVISSPGLKTGEFVSRYVFDSRFNFLGTYLQ
jgi:hypothetical protein